ncbi:hypothetical protein FG386_003149 [Cryptosporidium ryanae]|uniref:uncharacterized protein n=1 Tax=Cryptosporidium ryanae TaxID=515981 RepID=UPI00351A5777|nr:hypothetical protein FG386_003149 [Cryptosporidium ryanae]
MYGSKVAVFLLFFVLNSIYLFAPRSTQFVIALEKRTSERSSFEIFKGVKITSFNHTLSYKPEIYKVSRPAPFRLGILALLVSDFLLDNRLEIGEKLRDFDVIRFYEEILRQGGTRGISNFKDCCIDSCLFASFGSMGTIQKYVETINDLSVSICEGICDHSLHFLSSIDQFFLPSSELFDVKIVDRSTHDIPIKNENLNKKDDFSDLYNERASEELEDIEKIRHFSNENGEDMNLKNATFDLMSDFEENSPLSDVEVVNYMGEKDFESDDQHNIKSRLLLLWDVDRTLLDVFHLVNKGSVVGRIGKYNPFAMTLLFLIKERKQYDPRILEQYIVTFGAETIKKLQSSSLKKLCYSCWDIMRIYNRYFADESDSQTNQSFKRVIEAKEQNIISHMGEEYRFRNCPGPLKNLLYWKAKDLELFRNYIVSSDEILRNEYYDPSLIKVSNFEQDRNFRFPFKNREKGKIDEIVTILIDDTSSHVRLSCIEEYHENNLIVFPVVPFFGFSIDERMEQEMKGSQPNTLTVDFPGSEFNKLKGVNSKYLPDIINGVLNSNPINTSANEISKAIRKKISEHIPGRFPESQCNYDITQPKPLYFIFLSSCKFFNDIMTLFLNLPESHPSYSDITFLLSNVDAWEFDETKKSKMCSVVFETINKFINVCERSSKNVNTRSRFDQAEKMLSRRVCSFDWKHKFYFGFAVSEMGGPIPLNALAISLLPRKRTIILNIEADHLFNRFPLKLYNNKFFYCTIKTNLFSSTFETIRKIPIAMKSTLKNMAKRIKGSDTSNKAFEVTLNYAKVFQDQLKNLFEKSDSGSSGKHHFKMYEEYTNCIFVE